MSVNMATPEPKFPLSGHCSIIHDGTLYVYSPTGFQSLKLQEGAKWQALPMDISLTGAQCVKAVPKGDAKAAKLYIVGGVANETAATWNYPGLMHYSFSEKKWDWLRAESWSTQNRQNHGAVYLQDSQKILVYSGSQTTGDVGPSSQSFLFSTIPPYSVQGLPSAGAPPSVKPMLMSADANSALLVGGGATNTAVWKFNEAEGWRDLGVKLQQPIVNQEAVQCAVITGKDGSQALEKFDMSVTPNKVERILLVNKDGRPAAPGTNVGDKAKRVTVENWAAYNGTFAPTSARSGYSLAQGDDGLTVASGGNQTDPIVVFNAKANSWVNATEMFGGQQVILNSKTSSTISSTRPTSTASVSATPTIDAAAIPAAPPSHKGKMLTVLGATLGAIFGIAAILILILLCLKYRKTKRKQTHGYVEKDRMSFADRGADFMKEAGGSVVSQQYKMNNDSHSSLAIIQGRGANHKKNMASDASQAGLVKKTSPLGYSDPVELSKFDLKPEPVEIVRQNSSRIAHAAKPAPRARSSGWSRYFANNDATNLASVQPDRSTYASDRTSTGSQSQYTNSRMYSQRPSQHIAPLEIPKLDGQRISSVASGSPTLGTPNHLLPHQIQPMSAELARANSNGSSRSGVSHSDHYYEKPVESWTPVGDDRRTSSNYTGSMVIEPNAKYDVASSYYPDGTDSFYPKSNISSFYPGQGQSPIIPDARDSTFTMFPAGNAPAAPTDDMPKSRFSSMYPAPPRLGLPQDRQSTVTIFPGPNASEAAQQEALSNPNYNSFYPPPRVGHDSTVTMFPGPGPNQDDPKKGQSDMSWLNLGNSR
ncbi:uncharacterized protein K460DRAFT_359460 [Cucurbitaria berberidis CBS 394.84]|uniref:Pre-mRNA splicing factor CLF1 n=1 Tax=Cucurbitaria berberidis CBS 394.84 TaxID=1168544 RepID=A0A9P4G8D2_9PLEO|nr:uncharacterized protein K460DRAFT_359460 [Cucurbitaria berberidis CBS 394.84]KAF1840916.1 hypothetical protein K460DRAFT_359460 [Cucurbitaria berberidis CBS 394.84]